ncbi:hypothetical protein BGZ94_010333 [Podila epigama]|nr:hypothetical protein BGZ94_010333 [Podila epigama]
MSPNGLRVNITGIPGEGAKSRVETQIKLGIQLLNQQNELVGAWTHIKLPEYMVAKEKNKRINAKNIGHEVYEALNNGTCLNLEASVVCQSDRSKVIQTCTGCVLRERKRAHRKKSLGKKKVGLSPTSPQTTLDEDDPEQMALEQRKILLFNCTEIAEFSSGELILPTRITCYCRHHSEKLGFCIQFALRDHAGNLVAVGVSPPIMITDDHKASKVKKPDLAHPGQQRATSKKSAARATTTANRVITLTPPSSPTTPGDEVESEVDLGAGHDDEEEEEEEEDTEESEMDTASSSNASPSPLQTSMDISQYDPNSMSIVDLISQFSPLNDARQVPSPTSHLSPSQSGQTISSPDYSAFDGQHLHQQQQQQFQTMNGYIYNNDRMVPEQLVDIPVSLAPPSSSSDTRTRDLSQQQQQQQQHQLQQEQERQQQQHHQQLQLQQQHLQFQQLQQQALFPEAFGNVANATAAAASPAVARRTSTSGGVGPLRRRRAPVAANPLASSSLPSSAAAAAAVAANQPTMVVSPSPVVSVHPASMATTPSMLTPAPALPAILGLSSSLTMVPPGFIVPRMTRLIPNTGPCFGGIEITVLGANFYAGLTAMFDSTPALPTQFWSPNTLICILPPRIQPGTTIVTFKEHPTITLPQSGDVNEVMLFTYVDESDKALMELALQVVGLKMTGRLEDARNIALRIVGSQVANGGVQQGQGQQQGGGGGGQQQQNTMNYAELVRDLILSFGDQETDAQFQAGLEDRILTLLLVLSELPAPSHGVINLARRDTGHRLLHLSAMKGFELLVGALLANPELEIDGLDMNGYSALHYACWRGEVNCARMLVDHGADVMLRSIHGVGSVDLAGMHEEAVFGEFLRILKTSNSWVDAGAQEEYESAVEVDGDSEVDEELEALDEEGDEAVVEAEDSGVWLEHFATDSDILEEEEEEEEEEDEEIEKEGEKDEVTSFVGSEIEDMAWLDRGEWIGEELSSDSSSQWSGSDSGKPEDDQIVPTATTDADVYPPLATSTPCVNEQKGQSTPNLIPMATPLGTPTCVAGATADPDAKDAVASEMATNWIQKTLQHLQSSSPAFDFEFFKALNQILPEKGAFLMSIPSMPTSIQAFNANIGTYMPYNFTGGKTGVASTTASTTDDGTQVLDEKKPLQGPVYGHVRSGSLSGEAVLDEKAIEHELWTMHSKPESRTMNNNTLSLSSPPPLASGTTAATAAAPAAAMQEEVPSRYLNVYHEPFSATSVLQQPVNSYAMPSPDMAYSPLTLTTTATTATLNNKVRRVYPPMDNEDAESLLMQQPQSPPSIHHHNHQVRTLADIGESSVVRGGRRLISEIVNNGAVVGGAAVAERAVEAVGENRHIQELRAKYHQKMKRLKKDKMLFLFWVPVLLVMLALTIIRIASTFDVARQWTGGLMNFAGIQV